MASTQRPGLDPDPRPAPRSPALATGEHEQREVTLLEVVAAVAPFARSERELVAVVGRMVRSSGIRLVGNFRRGHLLAAPQARARARVPLSRGVTGT